jgi:peptidoglycan/LPS O-acetylase OafA/YrhL
VRSVPVARTDYNVGIGYLRAFATVLVIEHHAFLGYLSILPAQAAFGDPSGPWQAFPIVDPNRWIGFDLPIVWNDITLMSLMFFISGLFVLPGLRRKGGGAFLRDRALRLGVPFLVAATLVSPLAYSATYLATIPSPHVADFVGRWLALGNWPAGPAWFIWVLLAFDCVAALFFALARHWDDVVGRAPIDRVLRVPTAFFLTIVAVTAAAYLPMVFIFGPDAWTGVGPFVFQLSRILHYAAWFAAGVAVGAYGIERSLFASDGPLARAWARWLGAAAGVFGVAVAMIVAYLSAQTPVRLFGLGLTFVLACAVSILAATAIALRLARSRTAMLGSLRDDAYGMYLVHYAFVTWLQYAFLRAALPGALKGVAVFAGATALSWCTVAVLRRIPAVAKVI